MLIFDFLKLSHFRRKLTGQQCFELDFVESEVLIRGIKLPAVINPNHWLLHSSMAYYASPYDSAMCFSWDPVGMGAAIGAAQKITPLSYRPSWHSSYIYNQCSQKLLGSGLFGAGKLMGLAPYGSDSQQPASYQHINHANGISALSALYPVKESFAGKVVNAATAFHAQKMLDEHLTVIMEELYSLAIDNNVEPKLCLSGGTALNSVSNQLAFEASNFEELYIAPACGDDGTAIGGAMFVYHHMMGHPKYRHSDSDVAFSNKIYENEVDGVLKNHASANFLSVSSSDHYLADAAGLIAGGKIVAWFNGGSEIGPRSLGNRSILADPRDPNMKDKINRKVKFREPYRPFAPSVINDFALDYFSIKDSPFMLRVCNVESDDLPAIKHVDGTARVQTVTRGANPEYYDLLSKFKDLTGYPVLLNTSFNVKGEPIVETPEDAINCFLKSGLDALIFKHRIVTKSVNFDQEKFLASCRPVQVPKLPLSERVVRYLRKKLRFVRQRLLR